MTNLTKDDLLLASVKLATPLGHTRIFVDDNVCVAKKRIQFRLPRRKNKRIVSRWARNQRNWKYVVEERFYKTPFGIIVSKRMFSEIQKNLLPGTNHYDLDFNQRPRAAER